MLLGLFCYLFALCIFRMDFISRVGGKGVFSLYLFLVYLHLYLLIIEQSEDVGLPNSE